MFCPTTSMRRVAFRSGAIALIATLTGFVSPAAYGIERYVVPDQSASGPFYARLERGFVHMTDRWVAVAFYRDPACVRANFNLLNFFDFANIPAIFGCTLTVHGMEIWKNGVASDSGPMQSKLFGDGAVPVWFVSVPDFNAAAADNRVTIVELAGLPSLKKGYATYYEETLHPAGSATQTMLHISSYGWLEEGTAFQYEATEAGGRLTTVRIRLE
jgi:hypothetical protein